MPVSVVVGGQYGSEGKGKVAHCLAVENSAAAVVRIGGTNSGHTVVQAGSTYVLRQLPTAAVLSDVMCVLGPGSYVDAEILAREVSLLGLDERRLLVDENAVVITDAEKAAEGSLGLGPTIGSTLSGTGEAVRARTARNGTVSFAKNHPALSRWIGSAAPLLRDLLDRNERIVVEGTQGFGLSVLHSPTYPFVTSRDTSAAAMVSEAGLSPLDVDEIVLVLRAFPIRVAGHSGPLAGEISWETVTMEGRHDHPILELTSVTRNVRRVGRFDPGIVARAITVNRPSNIVINHLDYLDHEACVSREVTPEIGRFVSDIERTLGCHVNQLGIGADHLVARAPAYGRLVLSS